MKEVVAMDEMMKLSEIAALLKTAPSTPWRWVRRGILPAIQTPTGLIRVRRNDLERFIAAGTNQQERQKSNVSL